MDRAFVCCFVFLCFLIHLIVADWNILNQKTHNGVKISLKNYCESWRMNVELHNIRNFQVVPQECTEYIAKYVESTQYKVDSETATEECLVYLSTSCNLQKDGKDAWVFDIDDTLLSTIPFYKNVLENKINVTALEEWMSKGKAPALDYSLRLFNDIKSRGIQTILLSERREHLRSGTVDNLVNVGFHGWTSLILRDPANELVSVAEYKYRVREQLNSNGYRIWGILGHQFSSIAGNPSSTRAFKLPNPMYYVA